MGTPTPGLPQTDGHADDPLPESIELSRGAAAAGLSLKLPGGLAVRVLRPGFPARLRAGQDIDFACLSKGRKDVAAVDRLTSCHTLDLRPSFGRLPSRSSLRPRWVTIAFLAFDLRKWFTNDNYFVNNRDSLYFMGAMYVLAIVLYVVARLVCAAGRASTWG